MKMRFYLAGTAALFALAISPGKATAQSCGPAGYTATLGLGGALTGCFTATLQQVGENATGVGQQFFWTGNFSPVFGANNVTTGPAGTAFTGSPATTTAALRVDSAFRSSHTAAVARKLPRCSPAARCRRLARPASRSSTPPVNSSSACWRKI